MSVQDLQDRQPPWSETAEVSVIGACLVDPDAVGVALGLLDSGDFYREAHRRMFGAIGNLHAEGGAVDVVTVRQALDDAGELESAGGAAYLAELLDAVPSGAHVESHAKVVQQKAQLRQIIAVSSESIQDCMSNGSKPDAVIERVEERVLGLFRQDEGSGGYQHIRGAIHEAMALIEIEAEAKGGITGIPSGFPSLDRLTTGFQPGDMTVLAGRPSHGKSALAWIVVTSAARASHGAAVSSLEMSRGQLVKRGLAMRGEVDLQAIRRGSLERNDYVRLTDAGGWLDSMPIRIDDHPGGSVAEIRARLRRLIAEHPVGLLVVDYIQLMEAPGENRNQQVSVVSRGLKKLARDFDIHVLALSQLNRAVEARNPPRPKLGDLRDSGAIEQDADNVLQIWRPELYFTDATSNERRAKWQDQAELIIAKQRNGPLGRVMLRFAKEHVKFMELAET